MKTLKKQKNYKDWRGRIVWRLHLCFECLALGYYNFLGRLNAAWWGVELGKNCQFYGRIIFRRAPSSRIVIGDSCKFRSAEWSNQMGINHPCIISALREGAVVQIGSGSGFSATTISAAERIEIGEKVLCGANTVITDEDAHPLDPLLRHAPEADAHSPVFIENNAWLGMNVVVLKGVTIGKNSVIGVNSLVMSDIPADVVAAGTPAKAMRILNSQT